MAFTTSQQWKDGIALPHRAICRVDVLYGGDVVAQSVPVTAGQVTMDRTALVRGRCQLTLADPVNLPVDAAGLLAPFGAEVAIYRGVRWPDGTEELMPWGVFGIQSSTVTRRGYITQIDGLDRMQRIVDASTDVEVKIAASTNVVTALTTLAQSAWPAVTIHADATAHTTTEVVVSAGDNVAQRMVDIAQAAGMEVFFNHVGVLVVQDEPGAADPALTVREGAGGSLVELDLSLDRADAVNRVTVIGEHSGQSAAITATATDTLPTSPTRWDGPFGRKPVRISSPLYVDAAMAQAAADAALLKRRGVPKTITFEMVPDPSVREGDCVEVFAAGMVPYELHVIDKVTMPVTPDGGGMQMETRAVLVG